MDNRKEELERLKKDYLLLEQHCQDVVGAGGKHGFRRERQGDSKASVGGLVGWIILALILGRGLI